MGRRSFTPEQIINKFHDGWGSLDLGETVGGAGDKRSFLIHEEALWPPSQKALLCSGKKEHFTWTNSWGAGQHHCERRVLIYLKKTVTLFQTSNLTFSFVRAGTTEAWEGKTIVS